MTRKELIEITVKDLVSNFLYYDRKNDEELGPYDVIDSLLTGETSVEEILTIFKKELENQLNR